MQLPPVEQLSQRHDSGTIASNQFLQMHQPQQVAVENLVAVPSQPQRASPPATTEIEKIKVNEVKTNPIVQER